MWFIDCSYSHWWTKTLYAVAVLDNAWCGGVTFPRVRFQCWSISCYWLLTCAVVIWCYENCDSNNMSQEPTCPSYSRHNHDRLHTALLASRHHQCACRKPLHSHPYRALSHLITIIYRKSYPQITVPISWSPQHSSLIPRPPPFLFFGLRSV